MENKSMKKRRGLMAAALLAPAMLSASPVLGNMARKGIIASSPLTKKQIHNRKASKKARKARKISRPTY